MKAHNVEFIVGHYGAQNDVSGNPRRAFVLYEVHGPTAHNPQARYAVRAGAEDQGYNGDDYLTVGKLFAAQLRKARFSVLPLVKVTAAEYRRLLAEVRP